MNGTLARISPPLRAVARLARQRRGSAGFGFAAGGRIVAERTLSSRRVTSDSSACHCASTRSL